MATFKTTTKSWTLKDYGNVDPYKSTWQQGKLTITVNASGSGTWKLEMTNSGGGSDYTTVSLRLYINGTKIYDNFYNSGSSFPCKNGTSNTGNFTISSSTEKFKVDFGVCACQSATSTSNASRLTDGTMKRLGSASSDPQWGEYFVRDKETTVTTYTVTFNANGGSGAPSAQTKTKGTALTLSSTKPTRTGHTFQGWATTNTATTAQYAAGGSYTTDASVTLYAVWKANTYTVTYEENISGLTGLIVKNMPGDQTKEYGKNLTLSSNRPTRHKVLGAQTHSLVNWNTQSNGKGTSYAIGGTYTANSDVTLYAQWKTDDGSGSSGSSGGSSGSGTSTTKCAKPSITSLSDTGNNSIEFSCYPGSSGDNNERTQVEVFLAFNGDEPTTSSSYKQTFTIKETLGIASTINGTFDFSSKTQAQMQSILGNSCKSVIRLAARTLGSAGSSYYSDLDYYPTYLLGVTTNEKTFTWYGTTTAPQFTVPAQGASIKSKDTSYRVQWKAPAPGANCSIDSLLLAVYETTSGGSILQSYHFVSPTTQTYYDVPIPQSDSTSMRKYKFALYVADTHFSKSYDSSSADSIISNASLVAWSNELQVEYIAPMPSPTLSVLPSSVVPDVTINNKHTYVAINNDEILRLAWSKSEAINNPLDSYKINLTCYNDTFGTKTNSIIVDNYVEEFSITADILKEAIASGDRFTLTCTVIAVSSRGDEYSSAESASITVNITKGCGAYAKVYENGKPVMKQSVAIARVNDEDNGLLLDKSDVYLKDSNDVFLAVQCNTWAIMQEFYEKKDNKWNRVV